MAEGSRWVEVTPSPFPHEAEGLSIIRRLLPHVSPYRAWSNVEFRDGQGKWHEVDLIVLGQRRLHLVELKYYSGTLRGDDLRWLRDGHRAEDSPLKLARRKAQRLASKLQDELRRWSAETGTRIPDARDVVPFVQESVFLHHDGLRCVLPAASQVDLFGLDGGESTSGLPGISTRLLEPPTAREAITTTREAIIAALMTRIGLVQRRQREVGSWVIDDAPLGEGDGWQDWPASHRLIGKDRARIRVRVTPAGAAAREVANTRKVVEHEYRIMSRLAHDGVLRPRDLVDDDLGVGLVYPYDETYERLDLWQADRPQGVALADQLSLIRQVAEAVGYAHRHRVVHRGLSPHAVSVKELPGAGLRVLVGDWQSAGAATGEALTALTATGVTALAAAEAQDRLAGIMQPGVADVDRRQAEAFQAPEGVWKANADRVRLDVFALGALAYYVLAGRVPAQDRASLRERIGRDGGLDLAADLPQISSALRNLVLEATRPAVSQRLADVSAFLGALGKAERATGTTENVTDPLEAFPGDVIDGRWQLERRLGAGSTAVGLLVSDLAVGTGTDARRVLKVAVNDSAAGRLEAEAAALQALAEPSALATPRVVRLVEGPLQVGNRRALVLESAGDQTLADVLSGRTRLSLDLLQRWGVDLLEALVALDRAGVDHRDIKPANLGVREGRSDRTKHLVLFDFSLARAGATALTAGTPPYLDPFLESPGRGRYDSAAERYSAAVVLFEMATGRTPTYGDGLSDPAAVPDEAAIDEALFDPAVAVGIAAFFRTALARDARLRPDTAAGMLGAWQSLFVPVSTTIPDDADTRVENALPSTPLAEAGLSARALSALEPFAVTTVADLVAIDPVRLNRLAGVAEPTRREVKERARRWRERFAAAVTGRSRKALSEPGESTTADGTLSSTHAAHLIVEAVGSTKTPLRRQAAALLLGLEPGIAAFAAHGELAEALSMPRVRAVQLLGGMQDAWAADQASCDLLAAIADVATGSLVGLGGVATVEELTHAVLAAMSPGEPGELAPARLAAGLFRIALDRIDALERAGAGAAPARRRRNGRLILLAADPGMLDAAETLGARADELVEMSREAAEPVIAPGRAAAALRETFRPTVGARLSDERLVQLAASLSRSAALSGRGELHDIELDPAAALRLALAGIGGTQSLTAQEVRDRVHARFPALAPLPDRPRLDELIADAQLPLTYDARPRAFRAPTAIADTTGLESRVLTSVAIFGAPLSLSGGELDHRLAESVRSRSFLALGVDAPRVDRAITVLRERHGAVVLDLTGVLVDALHTQAEGRIPWRDVLSADARPAGSREKVGLTRLVDLAFPAVDAAIEAACGEAARGTCPVLLTEAAALAHFDRLADLSRWTDLASARVQAVWLLVPQLSGNTGAMVDGRPLPLAAPGQYVRLDSDWLVAAERGRSAVPAAASSAA